MSTISAPFWLPTWGEESIEIKRNNLMHKGFYQLSQMELRYKCFSGSWSPWLIREQVKNKDAAAVLLWDPKLDKLVLIEQIRIGLIGCQRKESPWLLEIVAGLQEGTESARETVLREAKEETGCHIEELIPIGEFYNTPGGFTEKSTVFCGIIDATNCQGVYGLKHAQEHEDIQVHVLSSAQVLEALKEGLLVTSASTLIALQWFALHNKK